MTTLPVAKPTTYVKPGALYFGDNGRTMCTDCAGASATFSGLDLSGHPISRVTTDDVAEWNHDAAATLGPLTCECRRVALSEIAGPDGWPLVSQARRCANPSHNHHAGHYVWALDGDDDAPSPRGKCRGCGAGMHSDHALTTYDKDNYIVPGYAHDDPDAACDALPERPEKASDCAWIGAA